MHTSWTRGTVGAFLVAVGWLLWQPGSGLFQIGTAQAQPQIFGRWSGALPAGGTMTLVFAPGEFVGHAVWRGPLTILINECEISRGTWELRMYTGTEGTLGIMDGFNISNSVGNIDLGAPGVAVRAAGWSAGVATLEANNSYSPGQTVVVNGISGAVAYNGTYTILAATPRTFSYALATPPTGTPSFTFATANQPFVLNYKNVNFRP